MSVIIQSRPRSTIVVKHKSTITLVKSLPVDLSGVQTQINELFARTSEAESDIDAIQASVLALQGDVSGIESELVTLNDSLATAQTNITALQNNVNTLEASLSSVQGDIFTIQSQINSINSTISVIQSAITTIQSNIATLQSQVATINSNVSGLQTDVSGLQSSVSTMQSQISTLQSNISTINTTILSIQSSISGLTLRVDNLEAGQALQDAEIDLINTTLTTINNDITSLEGSVSTIQSNISTLQGQVSTLDTEVNTLQSEVDALQAEDITLDSRLDVIDNNIKGIVAKEVQVLTIADLPTPVSGVITLPNERKIYKFYNQIDLQGNTLRTGENTFEAISQNDSGVSNGAVEILETLTVRFFQFIGCTITINTNTGAYDWETVNFTDCILNAQNFNNIVFKTIGFFGNTTMNVSGTFNSLIISPNCIFSGATANNHTYFKVANTAVCNRRIRIEDTVFTTGNATQKAIEVITGASIPTESFILDDINFSGTGTALTGINGNDSQNRALFGGCKGGNVINTSPNAYYTMINNAVATPALLATPTKILGTTVAQPISQLFDLSVSNRAIYKGVVPRVFKITALLSFTSGNNNQIGVYVAKNGVIVENFEPYVTTNGVGRAENAPTQEILQLNTNDYIEIWVENDTSATAITVQSLTVILNEV